MTDQELIKAIELAIKVDETLEAHGGGLAIDRGLLNMAIQRFSALQAENAEKDKRIAHVEAERDAAMKEIPRWCHTCKHKPTESKGGFGVCGMGCTVSSISVDHYELCKWEWCGAQGEA